MVTQAQRRTTLAGFNRVHDRMECVIINSTRPGHWKMPSKVEVSRAMARLDFNLQKAPSIVPRYGLAVASFAIALGVALLAQAYAFRNVEVPLFLFAVAITAWFAGSGPAAVTVVLSCVFFDYFFVPPLHSLG